MMERRKGVPIPEPELNIPHYYDLPEETESPELSNLRQIILQTREKEIVERISTNPVPDEEELSAGVYRELIEPQCRNAIFEMRRKGYDTGSSGFGTGGTQIVDGDLPLTQAVVDTLVHNGYVVYKVGGPSIKFKPKSSSADEIKEQWDRLAKLLPDLGFHARSRSKSLTYFYQNVKKSCPEIMSLQQQNDGSLVIRKSK